MVPFVTRTVPDELFRIPPPQGPLLPLMVLLIIVNRQPGLLFIPPPPPSDAELPLMVLLVTFTDPPLAIL